MQRKTEQNRFGLKRRIDAPIARLVRQRCGFGCVVCGKAIVDYEHVDPEFKDARKHDPDCIVLLCVEHHAYVTRGHWSKDTIKHYAQNPRAKQLGFSFGGPFDIGAKHPRIAIGTVTAINCNTLLQIDGEKIISIRPPTEFGEPHRINAWLCDENGTQILEIVDNIWQSSTANWDVDLEGPTLTIRNAPRDISVILKAEPPDGLVFERMRMKHRGITVECSRGSAVVVTFANGVSAQFEDLGCENWDVAINVSSGKRLIRRRPLLMSTTLLCAIS